MNLNKKCPKCKHPPHVKDKPVHTLYQDGDYGILADHITGEKAVIQDWLAHPENYTDIMPGSIPLPCPVATQKTSGKFYCTRENGHEGPCAAHPVNHKKSVMTFIREEN